MMKSTLLFGYKKVSSVMMNDDVTCFVYTFLKIYAFGWNGREKKRNILFIKLKKKFKHNVK